MSRLKTLGIVTTGGDAPGMNAAIRALTRFGKERNLHVLGFHKGWDGVDAMDFEILGARTVGGILQAGGTFLQTSRSKALRTDEGVKKLAENLDTLDVDALAVLGGNGSMKSAFKLGKQSSTRMIGIPCTIDNDVYGTDETIGFDTAVNTAVEQIDKIRDTAKSMGRVFVTEVMGRNHGFIALHTGVAVGADVILMPEVEYTQESVIENMQNCTKRGKRSGLVVMAEGAGDSREITRVLDYYLNADVRLSILGYSQRGGSPSARSRFLANLFAKEAIDSLTKGDEDILVVLDDRGVGTISLKTSVSNEKKIDEEYLALNRVLTL